jgi:hypothetical protein
MSEQTGGFSGFLGSVRRDPGEGRTLGEALAGTAGRSWYDAAEPEPVDADEKAANALARGYRPGMGADLAQRYGDKVSELESVREANANARKTQERIARDHAAGKITAFDIARMDFGEPDVAREQQLERQAESLRQQLADAQGLIAPAQAQRSQDPLEATTRRANATFRELTRQKVAAAQESRPQASPPFASRASAGAAGTEHTGADCWVCAEGRRREAAELGYSQYQPPDAQQSVWNSGQEVRRGNLGTGYAETPACDACGYVYCQCSQYPRAAGEPQVYA